MTETQSRIKRTLYFVTAAVLPLIIASLCLYLREMLPGQENKLVYGDYIHEYLAFFRHFWDALLHGKSLEYSFSLGIGSPTMGMYSIFAFSPFSIIPYIIKDVTLAAYISLMCKLSLASLALMFFLTYDLKCRRETGLLFSVFYSLSSYVLIYYINIHFLDVFYILPLLIHFLIKFVKEQKYLGLILLYSFSFINNFFEGYCVGFFSFVLYILLLWYMGIRGNRLRENIKKYILAVTIAVLFSLPVILPAVMYVIQHMPDGSDFSVIPLRASIYTFNSLLFGRRIRSIFDSMPAVYCGWPSMLLTVSFFVDKNDIKKKMLAGVPIMLLIVCCFWHPAYYFMHLCNEPDSFPWRFSFLLIFMFVCTAAYQYDHMEKKLFSKANLLPLLIVAIIVGTAYYLNRAELIGTDTLPMFLFIINMGFVLLHCLGDNKRIILYFIAIPELVCATYFQLPYLNSDNDQNEIKEEFKSIDKILDIIAEDESEFHRTCVFSGMTQNQAFMCDYPGFNFFCSFDNGRLIDALKLLGFEARPQQYDYYGHTEFTNMIFDVKYIGSNVAGKLVEDSPTLPLAFTVTDDIKDIELSDDPFRNHQTLADAMTFEDSVLYDSIEVEMGTTDGMELDVDYENEEYTFRKTGDGGLGVWYIKDIEKQPAYMFVSTGVRTAGVFEREYIMSGYPVRAEKPVAMPIINSFFKIDNKDKPGVVLKMYGDIGTEVSFKTTIAKCINLDAVERIYEELAPGGIKIDSFRDDRIQGRVTADEEHTVLFSSIPYDINWRIKIDGKEYETYAVFNGAFLACDITPGEHEIEYIYKDSSVTMGMAAFAVGFLLLMMSISKDHGKKKEQDQLIYDAVTDLSEDEGKENLES